MSKIIAAINMTLDGFCDHTASVADDEIHQHYADLLKSADAILYGRITYHLMEFWRPLIANPTGDKSMDEFAVVMNSTPKIVFSHTLKALDWESAELAHQTLKEKVLELKQQSSDKNFFVGSRSLIIQLMNLNLIDEYQFCVHPLVAGKGLRLFENVDHNITFKLLKTKVFLQSGAVILYYEPVHE